ncbi:GTP cyclohydrolase II [Sphingosinicella sp. BN140058]|uniref:GTP cyclohydrolase II n=1 Tax=Sphingosinicella sp. BN140058 TaxID=1892855 RepID=UPI001011EF40|nr:GTP cyclohydrolase II [Sphingosinicella sp. BN140058]QAY76873.1 GTP cyclohydrolase II [Sphingosinicella sp. BN140058]
MTARRDVARGIDALRRGWTVTIDGTAFLGVETADDAALSGFDTPRAADLLISGPRAVTLKLANQREAVPTGPVLIQRAPWIDLAEAIAIADPARDLSNPLKGPFRAGIAPAGAEAAIQLTRVAGLLPALFAGGTASDDSVRLSSADILAAVEHPTVTIASRARLPTEHSEKGEIVAFRTAGDPAEHIALLIGQPTGVPPLVRLHSECLTGDVLGSLKCDCGPQLDGALEAIAAAGWGILLYLRQEGRGIGLINKLRAYALQDQGFDTVDANLRLGFGDDERRFTVAARMLAALGQTEVRLLTNNPRKASGLEAAGIKVVERVPLQRGINPHNAAYLETKRTRSGHML